ncbi:hypothetical protein Rhe02_54510 [Rhizocola hellebori]|uniref:Uncharacterized protein n=1 Tax=Rhizocola hellebori TaxID=1392758 RepID=A0A8J3QCP3_9ACTN|nr:helix-turn-helix domain-containing protein [Rhizocola hellebori]GIH07384.1 hypothetical protein Rhe02_54510 [Rhizocola hellebori]
MPTKWAINKAVKASSLPSPSRLIMFALSDSADKDTAVVPEEHAPSLRQIAEWTGLGKATVARHLDLLEESGWLERERPSIEAARSEHAKTNYRLSIGHVSERDMPMSQSETCSDESMSQSGTSHVSERDKGMSQSGTVPLFPDHYQISPDHSSSENATTTKTKRRRRAKSKPKPPPDRPDVERICTHLADRVEANGSLRPTVTAKWRESARLLLDRDGRTEDQVMKAIDWCQANDFWRANVKSMPTLRKQYDTLRLHAKRPNGSASRNQLVQHNGMLLKPETVADLERRKRFEAIDAASTQQAIGGTK